MGRIPQLTLREILPKAFRYCCCFFYQLANNSDLELSLNTYRTTWFPITPNRFNKITWHKLQIGMGPSFCNDLRLYNVCFFWSQQCSQGEPRLTFQWVKNCFMLVWEPRIFPRHSCTWFPWFPASQQDSTGKPCHFRSFCFWLLKKQQKDSHVQHSQTSEQKLWKQMAADQAVEFHWVNCTGKT